MASAKAEELASMAGFTVAFFTQDKSRNGLWQWFNVALKENWTGDRLLQAVRNTKWFKTHSDAQREASLLRTSDPKTYAARVSQMRVRVGHMAVELGVPLADRYGDQIALMAFTNNWDDGQIRGYMMRYNAVYASISAGKLLGGSAGQVQTRLTQAAADNGIRLSPKTLGSWVQHVVHGALTEQHALGQIQNLAISAFPGLADRIKAGESVRDVAEPYMQTMAKLWEMNPADIDLFNPKLRSALNTRGQDGNYSMLTLPDFERQLKKDQRWMGTDNAQDELMENGHQVLNAFGVTW
jgi:hypothetical protein